MGTSKIYIEKREEREEREERKERGEDTDYDDEGRERRSAVVFLCVIFFVLVLGIPLMSS